MSEPTKKVEQYKQLVLEYEELDEQIDALLTANDGGTETMSDDDYRRYRELRDHRDEIHSQIKRLEIELFDEQ